MRTNLAVVILYAALNCVESELMTAILGTAGAVVAYGAYFTCYLGRECCRPEDIPADFHSLRRDLEKKIYGQQIVQETIALALEAHWKTPFPKKALTLSFHGWPGSGKNYVTSFIMKNLYKKGAESKHVHLFLGRVHFEQKHKVEEYQRNLRQWLKGNVSECPRQLFIFDEVDKMPAGVLDAIKPMIDYHDNIDKVDYRRSIFIFLSNTGASAINNHYLDLWRAGVRRDDIKLSDFENLIMKGSFNEEGGFYMSDMIKSNLIDHYVPFLPMERDHVKLCIMDSFRERGELKPPAQSIESVLNYVEWDPEPEKLFAKTGCKRISQKVAMEVMKLT